MVTFHRPDRVLLALTPNNRRAVLQKLATHIAHDLGRPVTGIYETLNNRQETHLTIIDKGVVVMDSLLPELDQSYLLLARLTHPVSFGVPDHQPVDLCAVILSSDQSRAAHLQVTARLIRYVLDPHILAAWRGAASVDAVGAIFAPDLSSARAA
jgi:mannitol/fructose-specific phosphotransferase system IIA component (Ntr-type)